QRTSTPAPAGGTEAALAAPADDEEASGNVLEDLMLQAEIFLQYGLKPRAVERLERIARIFPGEERRNEKLRSLHASAGFAGQSAAADGDDESAAAAPAAEMVDDVSTDVARVSEITRNIYRQAAVKSVLSTAVNEIGKAWRVGRCVAGLCVPGKPPSAAVEYCAPSMGQSDVKSIVKLVTTLVGLTTDGSPLAVEDIASSKKVAALAKTAQALGIKSLLAVPMMENEQVTGVVILEQCDRMRKWRANEIL